MKKKTIEEFKEELKNVQPNLLVLGEYKGANDRILVHDGYGECMCIPNSLLQGDKPSILSAIDKDAYFKAQLSVVQPDLLILGQYIDGKTRILVRNRYGGCACVPNELLRGSKPSIRTAINKTKYFISQAKEIHGDKYDYTKVKYVGSLTKIIVICPEHGEFEQIPNDHLKGTGCPACGNENSGGDGGYNPTSAERNRKEWENTSAIVYFIKCWNENEEFFKIGITTRSIRTRFSGFEYRFEIIREINTNLYDAVYLEQHLHEQHKKFKYTPKIKFNGHTECFSKLI